MAHWTPESDRRLFLGLLKQLPATITTETWDQVAGVVGSKYTPKACLERYKKLKYESNEGPFAPATPSNTAGYAEAARSSELVPGSSRKRKVSEVDELDVEIVGAAERLVKMKMESGGVKRRRYWW